MLSIVLEVEIFYGHSLKQQNIGCKESWRDKILDHIVASAEYQIQVWLLEKGIKFESLSFTN